jgi:hypothetical protein
MTDNEDILRRIVALENGLAEQQSQTIVVRSTMTQETALRQHLQSAYQVIKTKFDQVEQRQQALETKAGMEFSQLQQQLNESQNLLHAILGEIQGSKKKRNDRREENDNYEL